MLVVLGAMFFLKDQMPVTQTASSSVQPDLEVNLATLLADYGGEGNEIAADNKYKGKIVRTAGVIQDISKDITDAPYVTLSTSMELSIPELQCSLAKSAVDYASSLGVGQIVVMQGKVTGLMLNVLAEDCTFVQPEDIKAEATESGASESESTTLEEAAEEQEAVADEPEPMSDEEIRARQCTVTYRGATPESYSPEAVAEYLSECPGYDLPIAWQEMVTASETEPQALLPASFDCAKAGSAVEKMICGDPAISDLDGQLAKLYSAARQSSADTEALKLVQREWVKKRNACSDSSCLKSAYEERIAELQ